MVWLTSMNPAVGMEANAIRYLPGYSERGRAIFKLKETVSHLPTL